MVGDGPVLPKARNTEFNLMEVVIMYRFAGFIIGCLIAALGAPLVCLAETNVEIVSETEFVPEVETVRQPTGHWVPLGEYKLTWYCNCRRCCGRWAGGPCANGQMPAEGRTVACGSLPLGTRILIAGQGEYVVEDRGVTGKHIDIFMASHSACLRNGVQRAGVFRWVAD